MAGRAYGRYQRLSQDLVGAEHSAKDFRTWHATVLAAIDIALVSGTDGSAPAAKRNVAATVRRVADHLSNTPAVCRASYIDPRVFDRYREGRTVAPALQRIDVDPEGAREAVERAVLHLLGSDDHAALAA